MPFSLALLACGPSLHTDSAEPPPWVCPGDGICGGGLVEIEGGAFTMGSEDPDADEVERPAHEVEVAAFGLDRFEVTHREFAAWLRWLDEAGTPNACPKDGSPFDCLACDLPGVSIDCEDDHAIAETCDGGACDDHPVTGLTWYGCRAFCEANGKRLPTEAEWERAAQGPEPGRLFPWGDDCPTGFLLDDGSCGGESWTPDTALASCAESACSDGWEGTAPVGALPDGDSAEGVADLAGNVWEWVEDCWHRSYEGAPESGSAWLDACSPLGRVQRGGSWFHEGETLRTMHRGFYPPAEANTSLGCRCVE